MSVKFLYIKTFVYMHKIFSFSILYEPEQNLEMFPWQLTEISLLFKCLVYFD